MLVSIIAAMDRNRLIGNKNQLPWNLPADLAHFKKVTMGKPIIMGRKTFESIGRPLPGRTNVVISRDPHYSADGVKVVNSLDAALRLAEDIALIDGAEEMVVIGGAEIYREALPLARRLYLTEVHAVVDGDARLPDIDWDCWREVRRERHDAEGNNPYDYSFVVFERRRT